jgi:cytochrome c peroxidase
MHAVGGLNTEEDDPRYLGRGMFTGDEDDMYAFKVPQLYNLKDYVSFFHGSSKTSIEDVVDFKIAATSENEKVNQDRLAISPLILTGEERSNLIDFLTNALHDGNMNRYVPDSIQSGLCFPNNDPESRKDIGCN